MANVFEILLLVAYFVPAFILMVFGLNLYFMIFMFVRRQQNARDELGDLMDAYHRRFTHDDLPHVVTQLPVYNELNVAERILRSAAAMDYPADRHTIQVLDDSNDETRELVDAVAAELRGTGIQVEVLRRENREGYKAGALEYGLNRTDADFFAIFDADFVPPRDFLLRTIPVLMMREDVGMVQARWGHLNAGASMITKAQGVGIDGHFAIEQPARAWNHLFMNFNGTAGLWRRQAIEEAGGWEHDTLTEDMDLSYRSQLEGWKPFFLLDLVVPAEIPADINAFKSQQFRWAKGSIQTALKLLPRVFRSPAPLSAKIQSIFHMTHYAIHPLMLWLAIWAMPVLVFTRFEYSTAVFVALFTVFVLGTLAPTTLYAVSQCCLYERGWRRLRFLPVLTSLGVGIAISNSRAVFEALIGHDSPFVRTPKAGDLQRHAYAVRMPYVAIMELLVGIYCFVSLGYFMTSDRYVIGPFLLLYACGFTAVGTLSMLHAIVQHRLLRGHAD